MPTESTDNSSRATHVHQPATDAPEGPPCLGREDVGGYFDIVRLGPPICLPILPKPPYERPELEPLGDPRQRQATP
jgi:hypothetical protein